MGHTRWNLSEWVNRLVPDSSAAEPETLNIVVPNVTLGDHSAITSPVLPPMAWVGAYVAAVAGQFALFHVTSRGKGGCFIRQVHLSGVTGNLLAQWSQKRSEGGLGVGVITDQAPAPAVQNMGPEAIKSTVRVGTSTIVQPDKNPSVRGVAGVVQQIHDGWYLPPGDVILFQRTTVNTDMSFAVLIQDVPATVPQQTVVP